MEEIDKKIRAYYKSKSLSKDKIGAIVDGKNRNPKNLRRSFLKYVAVLCLSAVCFFFYQYQSPEKECILEKYAKEVAFNHRKNLQSDILTASIEDLNNKMEKLNFDLHLPERINTEYSLLGGRYCSIDERLAAQLKLKNKDSDLVVTLYILDKLKNENYNNSLVIDSTSIEIWNDQSSLFVLASNSTK